MSARGGKFRMRRSFFGRLLFFIFRLLPWRTRLLSIVVALEGGQLYSSTLRGVLDRHYGVKAGPYSYGSLLVPGMADRGTTIGAYASTGPGVRRFGASHPLDALSLHPFLYNPALGLVGPGRDVSRSACEIGPDCWIGANVVILPRCSRIGAGAVIGAGTVVVGDVPDFGIVFGNPGRLIRTRLAPRVQQALLAARLWELEPEDLVSQIELMVEAIESP